MGFFDDLKTGLGIVGHTVLDVLEGGLKTAGAAAAGFVGGGPIGAITAGISTGISSVGTLINRIHSYSHPTSPDGTANHATIASVLDPIGPLVTASKAMGAVSKDSPASVNEVAGAGANFLDGMAKHGNSLEAAARYAGSTPISKHIGNSLSSSIVGHVKNRIGFDAVNHMRFGASATREAQMLPTTSAFHGRVSDFMNYGGAEALAMKRLAMQGGGAISRDIVVGGAGA